MAEKLHRLSNVGGAPRRNRKAAIDSVAEYSSATERGMRVLMEAQNYWNSMDQFRRDRQRNKNYTYGRQWDDVICVDGHRMREEDYIKSQGNVALKNNLIRKMVRSILGLFKTQALTPVCVARDRDEQQLGETMTVTLECNMNLNKMRELHARSMEEFLISGFVVHRKWYGWRMERTDCWTDYVQPDNFFIDNNMRDFRGWDCSCVGEIHDLPFESLCQEFAKSPADYAHLREVYAMARERDVIAGTYQQFGVPIDTRCSDFLVPSDTTRCRVIEVWRKETKERYRCHDYNTGDYYKIETADYDRMVRAVNEDRIRRGLAAGMPEEEIPLIEAEWFIDSYWYYYYLTPFGEILKEGETPYWHKSHPYVWKAYPMIDGEIHSYVADVIDQQRYVNRLIIMYDWIMRASAKGVLLFPEECLPTGMTMDDIADEWARFNGVIMMRQPKSGTAIPQQIANNCTNIGIHELLNIQLKFFEDISGVNGAIQGKEGFAGMSASLYHQQSQNATTSLQDILDTYKDFQEEGAMKDVKNIQQFYDEPRLINISGKSAYVRYDSRSQRNVDYDLKIAQSQSSPVYRAAANDFMMELWKANGITTKQLLEYGCFPFADGLLQSINADEQRMAQGQPPQGIPPEMMAQSTQAADPQAVAKAQQMLRR